MGFLQRQVAARMRERAIENLLVREIEKRGGLCMKFVSPGTRGAPDRIVIMPHGAHCTKHGVQLDDQEYRVHTIDHTRESCRIYFVELKAPTGRLSAGQSLFTNELRSRGAMVQQLYSPQDVGRFLAHLDRNV